jgi:serine/threonine protein kinase
MALEMFQEKTWLTSSAHDIWSFGITLVELFCGNVANSVRQEIDNRKEFCSLQLEEQLKILEPAYAKMLEKVDEQPLPETLKLLIKSCVSRNPKGRPTAAQARKELETIFSNNQIV